MKKKTSDILIIGMFLLLIGAMFLIFLFSPAKNFSEVENRSLAQMPEFNLKNLATGKFMTDFESFLTDQFPFRDTWTDAKARCEKLLLKKEFNGVYLCEDGSLITRFDKPNYTLVERNVEAINTLAENTDAQVWLSIVPSAACIYSDKLPENAPNYDQTALIEHIYEKADVPVVDVASALMEHRDEYIFYRTDHHWTTLGAYYGYEALMQAMGQPVIPLSSYSPTVVTDEFYGTVYSSSGVHWTEPDSITLYAEDTGLEIENHSDGSAKPGQLYDKGFLERKDKYSMFFGGNTPLLVIRTNVPDAQNILILRDSYMDSECPFMLQNFSAIHMMDLRYYRLSVQEYIEENQIDVVLVSYGATNFASDSSVLLAAS